MDFTNLHYCVVGAGLWGGVLAERISTVLGENVLVLERRKHSGGNCHSYIDEETGIECHAYGTHVFHTSIPRVWEYINRFSMFTPYRHKVLTEYQGRVYAMPINLGTINSYYGLNLKPYEVEAFIRAEAGQAQGSSGGESAQNLEEKAISLVGRPLYEAFYKGYTWKQWNRDPKELPADIITRLPVRTHYNTDYFNDPWQGMPTEGYAALFNRLFSQPRIELVLGVDYADVADQLPRDCRIFYSGAVDEFLGYTRGALEWRSLRFEKEIVPYADFQGTSVMNMADVGVPYTRIHEYKHLHPERGLQGEKSVIIREFSKRCTQNGEPYYPINTTKNEQLLQAYQHDLQALPQVTLGGRLGAYRYMDMDKTIDSALACFDAEKNRCGYVSA